MIGTRGYRPFWPELEPRKRSRLVWCASCRRNGDRTKHLSTARHRFSTRGAEYAKGSGDHLARRQFDYFRHPADDGTPAQNRAAARRLAAMV